jgi:hypothetical protein
MLCGGFAPFRIEALAAPDTAQRATKEIAFHTI